MIDANEALSAVQLNGQPRVRVQGNARSVVEGDIELLSATGAIHFFAIIDGDKTGNCHAGRQCSGRQPDPNPAGESGFSRRAQNGMSLRIFHQPAQRIQSCW